MNIQEIVNCIQQSEVEKAQEQVAKMESEDLSVLGPMNMLAFEN